MTPDLQMMPYLPIQQLLGRALWREITASMSTHMTADLLGLQKEVLAD